MKNLSKTTKEEQENFFKSFDHILCDVDGVLWLAYNKISGAVDAINNLKKMGKKVTFVSNNCTISLDTYYKNLKSVGVDLNKEDLILPVLAMIDYLKRINFDKEIYLIGMTALRQELENAGFKIAEYGPDSVEESVPTYIRLAVQKNPNVGAVIADIDVNLNMVKLQRAVTYLHDPNVIFITGGQDVRLVLGENLVMIGPGNFQKIIQDMTGRTPHCLAKPSEELNSYIKEKLKIDDPARVLFIGDSISEDMGFAAKCGYKKLLVLSGLTKQDNLENWSYSEELKPDYYVDSLKNVNDLIA